MLEQQPDCRFVDLPPWCHVTLRPHTRNFRGKVDALDQNRLLLLRRHCQWVLVGIAVNPDFVLCIRYHLRLVREGLKGMAGDEPGGLNPESVKELEQAGRSDFASKHSVRNVKRGILSFIRTEPASNRIKTYYSFRRDD